MSASVPEADEIGPRYAAVMRLLNSLQALQPFSSTSGSTSTSLSGIATGEVAPAHRATVPQVGRQIMPQQPSQTTMFQDRLKDRKIRSHLTISTDTGLLPTAKDVNSVVAHLGGESSSESRGGQQFYCQEEDLSMNHSEQHVNFPRDWSSRIRSERDSFPSMACAVSVPLLKSASAEQLATLPRNLKGQTGGTVGFSAATDVWKAKSLRATDLIDMYSNQASIEVDKVLQKDEKWIMDSTVQMKTGTMTVQKSRRESAAVWRGHNTTSNLSRARTTAPPDRYLSPRPVAESRSTAFRVGKHPNRLTAQERYTRQRDHSISPFRSPNRSRSRDAVQRRPNIPGQRSSPMYYIPSFVNGNDATPLHTDATTFEEPPRQISVGGVWNVGGSSAARTGVTHAVPDGSGGLLASGSNAPLHAAHFLDEDSPTDQAKAHENRLALALDIDQTRPVLMTPIQIPSTPCSLASKYSPFSWQNGVWTRVHDQQQIWSDVHLNQTSSAKVVPVTPFRVLDAPNLKDDYYCTVLAYSHSHRTLAVALWQKVYLWTEEEGVKYPPIPQARHANFVTSLSFSSTEGARGILAISRHSGQVLLWGINEEWARFEAPHANSVSCLSFKPTLSERQSAVLNATIVSCEDLLVGDDIGTIFYYSVEWPESAQFASSRTNSGSMTLLATISAHLQNICGLAWSPDGRCFASGGNDNTAFFFETANVLSYEDEFSRNQPRGRTLHRAGSHSALTATLGTSSNITPPASPERPYITGTHDFQSFSPTWANTFSPMPATPPQSPPRPRARAITPRPSANPELALRPQPRLPAIHLIRPSLILHRLALPSLEPIQNAHTHSFVHSAAVKALAFAPWQPSLLATGGGSNDRQIHFHHTGSGATLAVINVFAQITCLIWSKTRREIAATFGYAQPEHGIRVAVFAWPSCDCVVKIPWEGRNGGAGEVPRALWAVGYPGGPNDGASPSRKVRERARRPRQPGTEEEESFTQWEAVRQRARRLRARDEATLPDLGTAVDGERPRGNTIPTPSPERGRSRKRPLNKPTAGAIAVEGHAWTSRTTEEGSLIIACCDQTVKFFEVWAGSSKGRNGRGLGGKAGVLGGSRILEGETVGIYEDDNAPGPERKMVHDVIR